MRLLVLLYSVHTYSGTMAQAWRGGIGKYPAHLERPNVLAHTLGGMAEAADFFLKTPKLTASNFAAL